MSRTDSHGIEIIEVAASATHPLRRRVLRDGTPATAVELDGDDEPTTRHLAALIEGRVVGVATWLVRPCSHVPDVLGVQLRAMAVDPEHRVRGIGRELAQAGVAAARADGVGVVWARARDSALGFYRQLGFVVIDPGYVDPTTALAHHDIVLVL